MADEKRPSAASRSALVIAEYKKYTSQPAHQLAGVAMSRSLFVATPLSGFRLPCIWAFLTSHPAGSHSSLWNPARL